MDVELFLHGVPNGQDFYGIEEECNSIAQFYTKSDESIKLIIETKKFGSTFYAYYTYLRYNNVLGSSGRTGSYFGLTLRMDKYYQDAQQIYAMLDMVFKKYVVGSILTISNTNYKYEDPKFESKKGDIDQLKQGFIQLFQSVCVSSKFMDIDASLVHPIQNAVQYNLYDANDNAVLSSIKKYSKVILSPQYKTAKVVELEQEISRAKNSSGSAVAANNARLMELENKVANFESKTIALNNQLKQQQDEILRLQKESDMASKIASIKGSIVTIAEYFGMFPKDKILDNLPRPNEKLPQYVLVSCALSFVAVVLCFIILAKGPSRNEEDVNFVNSKEYKELSSQNKELKEDNENLRISLQNLQQNIDKQKTETDWKAQVEQNRKAAEAAKKAEDERKAAEAAKKAEQDRKAAEAAKKAEQNRKAAEAAKKAEEERKAADAAKKAEEDRKAANAAKKAEEERKAAEAAKKAEEERKAADAANKSQIDCTPKISVDGNVSTVKNGEKYTFTVSCACDGKWSMDGFEAQKGNITDKTIVVKAKKPTGNVHVISFTADDGKKDTKQF